MRYAQPFLQDSVQSKGLVNWIQGMKRHVFPPYFLTTAVVFLGGSSQALAPRPLQGFLSVEEARDSVEGSIRDWHEIIPYLPPHPGLLLEHAGWRSCPWNTENRWLLPGCGCLGSTLQDFLPPACYHSSSHTCSFPLLEREPSLTVRHSSQDSVESLLSLQWDLMGVCVQV